MATQAEKAFIQHLTLVDSIKRMVAIGLPFDALADGGLRAVHKFALDYYHDSFAGAAPSSEALKDHFGNLLAEHEIDTDIEPEDDLAWAIEHIRGSYFDRHWQAWIRKFATDMSEAQVLDKHTVFNVALNDLMGIQTAFTRKTHRVDLREGIEARLVAHNERREGRERHEVVGLRLGMNLIDEHTMGIWPGELAVFAGVPKSGKSFGLDWSALCHWRAGGDPVLMTLENSVEMTLDRLACMDQRIDLRRWMKGECNDQELGLIRGWVERLKEHEHPFIIQQPVPGERTVENMVRLAKTQGDALYIDQLTFVDPPSRSDRKPRDQQVRDILHDLKSIISSGDRIPCLLAHQINREGQKAAEKSGKLEMYHLAESSEVERTADWVFGLWQSDSLRNQGRAYIRLLAARREDLRDWELVWRPWVGQVLMRGVIDMSGV